MKLSLLLLALLATPALAQAPPLYDLAEGDYIRVWSGPPGPSLPATVEGHLATFSADSLLIVANAEPVDHGLAWQSVRRVERREQNRSGEVVGMVLGLVTGVVVGSLIGDSVKPHSFGGPIGGGVIGGFVGLSVGAAVGTRIDRPWVEVPRGMRHR